MISYILSNSELSQLFQFLSPNWLKATSPLSVLKIVKQLKTNHSDRKHWDQTKEVTSKNLIHLGLKLEEHLIFPTAGECALSIFFAQILYQDTWILDLRTNSFQGTLNSWAWLPKQYYYKIKPEFLSGIRGLYRGFYREDSALFDEALEGLHLSAAKDVFRKHFGTGDQSAVSFHLATFQSTFAAVFESCVREKIQLDPDFFILGFMLLGLYENLERSGKSFDVRSVFKSVDHS